MRYKNFNQLFNLESNDFIKEINKINEEDIFQELENNSTMQEKYQKKVLQVYQNYLDERAFIKRHPFIHSKTLLSLLDKEKLGKLLVFQGGFNDEFLEYYQYIILKAKTNENLYEFGPRVLINEIKRLETNNQYQHLENNIDYLKYIQYFEPMLERKTFLFYLYVLFIKNIKLSIQLNEQNYLEKFNFQEKEEKENKNINHKLKNSIKIIEKFKQYLSFENWNEELLEKFHKDLKISFPYSNMGVVERASEDENFQNHSEFLEKIRMNNDLEKELRKKTKDNKNIKI